MRKIRQFIQYVRHDLRYYAAVCAEFKGFDCWKEFRQLFNYVFKDGPKPEYIQSPEELELIAAEDWWYWLYEYDLKEKQKKVEPINPGAR